MPELAASIWRAFINAASTRNSEMQPSPHAGARAVWLIIFGALTISIFTYGALVWMMSNSVTRRATSASISPTLITIMSALAVVMLVASVVVMSFGTAGKIGDARVIAPSVPVPLMEPARFQTVSIIALALSEACTVIGLLLFFLSRSSEQFVYFAAGSVLVNLLLILPRGLKYWKNLEASAAGDLDRNETPFSS